MRDENTNDLRPDLDVDIERAAWFARADGQIQSPHRADRQPRQDGIPVMGPFVMFGGALQSVVAGGFRQIFELVQSYFPPVMPPDLLKTDDIGVKVRDDGGNAFGREFGVGTDTAMNVVGGDTQSGRRIPWPPGTPIPLVDGTGAAPVRTVNVLELHHDHSTLTLDHAELCV